MIYALTFVAVLTLSFAANWVFDSIRELQKENARLRDELQRLRLHDRMNGLSAAFDRLPIPIHLVLGTLEGFELGMPEHEVHERVSRLGGQTLESPSTLTYTLEVGDWRAGERWTAGLVVHGGLLDEVWLHALACPPETRTAVEGALRDTFGEPTPRAEENSLLSTDLREKLLKTERRLKLISWRLSMFGHSVRASVSGEKNVMVRVGLSPN